MINLPFRKSDDVIHDGSAMWVVWLGTSEEAVIDPLGDDDVRELDFLHACILEAILDSLYLSFDHCMDLTVTNTVPRNVF